MPSRFTGSAAVLGVEVVFESNFPEALTAALAVCSSRNNRETMSPPPTVYIVLAADHAINTLAREHRISGKRLHINGDGIRLDADGELGRATCSFPIDAIDGDLFREAVNTAVLFLVAQTGRIPVHASALMIGDCAYVLAGRSGSGKSALAFAGNLAGLPVLAEDTVFVQREPSFRVWGLADHIHLHEKDAPPGAEGLMRLRSGRAKRALAIKDSRHSAEQSVLCVILGGDRVSLDPLSPEDAVRALIHEPEPGYDYFGTQMEEAIRSIAAGGCWQLTISHDPNAAISKLIDTFRAPNPRGQSS
jgi:hypothetical protein